MPDTIDMRTVMKRYGFSQMGQSVHIPEAENGLVYKVRFDGKDYMVKRMHRNTKATDIDYIHAFTSWVNSHVPAVAVLEHALDGAIYIGEEGAYIVVGKWLPGDKNKSTETWALREVAGLLASFHRVSLSWPDGGPRLGMPPLGELDWNRNAMFTRDTVIDVLTRDPSPMFRTSRAEDRPHVEYILSRRELILHEYDKTATWMSVLSSSGRPLLKAVIHGDIYPSNLLWQDKSITAVLDFDSSQFEPLAYELGRVLWEYCKNSEQGTIDPVRSDCFLKSYFDAGGPVPQDQLDLIVPYIRMLRITEILFYIQNAVIGDYWSASYSAANLRALENLPET